MPYFILLVAFIMSNGAILKWLDRYHIAATGFVWFLLPSLQYGLIESRQLKTRNIYEDHYRFLRGIMYFTFIIPPIFFVFIQFVFRGEIGYQDAVMYGLVPFAIAYATGFAAMLIVKPIMKKRLRYFLKKKKFERTKSEKLANYAILALPLYLLVVFLI